MGCHGQFDCERAGGGGLAAWPQRLSATMRKQEGVRAERKGGLACAKFRVLQKSITLYFQPFQLQLDCYISKINEWHNNSINVVLYM